jgi:hypothetical protein
MCHISGDLFNPRRPIQHSVTSFQKLGRAYATRPGTSIDGRDLVVVSLYGGANLI